MTKDSLNDYSATPGSNSEIAGISIAEGCAAGNVNDALRELMAQIADCIAGTVMLDRLDVADLRATDLTLTNAVASVNLTPTGYVTVGSPTGGQQGTGTINAVGIYDDGVLLKSTFPWSLTLNWAQGAVVQDGTIIFTAYAPFPGTVSAMSYNVGDAAGSFTCNVKIGATSITGLSSVAVNSATTASANATAANTFAAGDKIEVAITSTSGSPANAFLALRGTRT